MEYILLIVSLLVVALAIWAAVSQPANIGETFYTVGRRTNVKLCNSRGFVSPFEIRTYGEEAAYEAIDVSKLDVESFGRRKGSFGKWGYCVTNPICINDMDKNLQRYISHLFYENTRVESYDTEEVYNVSLFDKPVYKISLLMKGSHKVIYLYFIDSTYENHEIFPDGFSDYAIYLKKQKTEKEERKQEKKNVQTNTSEYDPNKVRFSLRTNMNDDLFREVYGDINLRDTEHRYAKQRSLELYEKMKKGNAEIKCIWKK